MVDYVHLLVHKVITRIPREPPRRRTLVTGGRGSFDGRSNHVRRVDIIISTSEAKRKQLARRLSDSIEHVKQIRDPSFVDLLRNVSVVLSALFHCLLGTSGIPTAESWPHLHGLFSHNVCKSNHLHIASLISRALVQ